MHWNKDWNKAKNPHHPKSSNISSNIFAILTLPLFAALKALILEENSIITETVSNNLLSL